MDVREKLVELVKRAIIDWEHGDASEWISDHLIANGVTVQDGKPLDAFLHPIDAYKGLKAKYLVFKADTGERVGNCFVLRPDKDPAAVEAIKAYARATDNETLAEDIYNWVGKGEPVQEWISVNDRLPTQEDAPTEYVFTAYKNQNCYDVGIALWDTVVAYPDLYDYWMALPLPQPPKGE